MDITSYLLGKKSSGGGTDLSEYFGDITKPVWNPGAYVKKIPYDIDVDGVTNLGSFFQHWQNLESVTLKNANSVTMIRTLFDGCKKLMFIDIRDITISTMSYSNYQSFLGSYSNGRVPYNCLIVVKDSTEKEWLNTNFSEYTNVKTVDEYENS